MSGWNETSERIDAVLFDLGNTLVAYYRRTEFDPVLRRCLTAAAAHLRARDAAGADPRPAFDLVALCQRARPFNTERVDSRVWPLRERLAQIFALDGAPAELLEELSLAFLEPIFAIARPDPEAVNVLRKIRELGLKSAIVSNTPWGSPAAAWRRELARLGLLEEVDAAVFCTDVGWRKPASPIFTHALDALGVPAERALFVGDDPHWDVAGAKHAGLTPVLLDQAGTATAECRTVRRLTELVPWLAAGRSGRAAASASYSRGAE